jgi:hypothetical protein
MAKLLGVREVGVGQLPAFMRRAQDVSLMGIGNYERAQSGDRRYSPYDSAFGQLQTPYDLNETGAVAEIKVVLRELAKLGADPLGPDPITEETWQFIDTSPEYIDAWDGPTADEFLLAVGRRRATSAPVKNAPFATAALAESKGRFEIIGGPQPTVSGLELLAQAAHELLKDSVQLDNYLAWRGGNLDDWFGGPPEALSIPTSRFGRQWDPRGWTFAWRDGDVAKANPEMIAQLDMIEESIKHSWNYAQQTANEAYRANRANILRDLRQQRHDLVLALNQGAPPPECSAGLIWSRTKSTCVDRCPGQKWDAVRGACVTTVTPAELPYATHAECVDQHRQDGFSEEYADTQCALEFPDRGVSAAALVGLAAAAGLGALWWWRRRQSGSTGKASQAVSWAMKAPED